MNENEDDMYTWGSEEEEFWKSDMTWVGEYASANQDHNLISRYSTGLKAEIVGGIGTLLTVEVTEHQ